MKFLTLCVAVIFIVGCETRSSDEEQVRALLAAAEIAAESRDASDVLEAVAADYSDSEGLDRAQLQNFLRGYFLSHPSIELLMSIQELEFPVEGLARARIGITVLPLRVEFRKVGGEWRVARADRIRD